MPRLTDATKQQRREQIATAAIRCIARKGFAETSVADIIEESGLSAGSIYSHFSSKTEIVHAVASDILRARKTRLPGADGSIVSPGRLLGALMDGLDAEFARTLLQVWAEVAHSDDLSELARRNIAGLREVIRDRLASWVDARATETGEERGLVETRYVDAVMAGAQGYLMRLAVDRDVDAAALRANLTRVLDGS